jgi:hypothetical protein
MSKSCYFTRLSQSRSDDFHKEVSLGLDVQAPRVTLADGRTVPEFQPV